MPAFLRRQRYRDRIGNHARDLAGQLEQIGGRPLVGLRPDQGFVSTHQPHQHAQSIARAFDRSFDQAVHVQLARDVRHRQLPPLERHRRGQRDEAHGTERREVPNEEVRDSVRQELLIGLAREIGERQHHEGANPRGARHPLVVHEPGADGDCHDYQSGHAPPRHDRSAGAASETSDECLGMEHPFERMLEDRCGLRPA